ncbi:hypothetical protein [Mycolicibacterium sp. XJ775]
MATNHQLAQLIDGVKAANSWSDPDLVKNAKEKGHVLSKSNISRYRNPLVSIKGEIILALAAGLRVAPSQVAVAAIQSMGIQLAQYDAATPEQAVSLDTQLSARDKATLLALIGQLRDSAAPARAPDEAPEGEEAGSYEPKRRGDRIGRLPRTRAVEDAGEDRSDQSNKRHQL